jgi:hypothetical protein
MALSTMHAIATAAGKARRRLVIITQVRVHSSRHDDKERIRADGFSG